jgi:RNA polymerase sigma-B factor
MVRPPRRVQELQARISRAQNELEARLGRSPRPTELADHLDVQIEEIIEALTADGCFTPTSLDGPIGGGSAVLGDLLPLDGSDLDCAEARIMLSPILKVLTERDLLVLRMRFIEQRTQQEIGEAIGLTQAQVSRKLVNILRQLRAELE